MNQPPQSSDPKLNMRVLKTRHDLHNSIGHVLGFSEMLLEESREQGHDGLRPGLEHLVQGSKQMIAQLNEDLQTPRIEAGLSNISGLERQLRDWATQVIASVEALTLASPNVTDEVFKSDLTRITGAARRTHELASTSLAHLTISTLGETAFLVRAINPLLDLLPDRPG